MQRPQRPPRQLMPHTYTLKYIKRLSHGRVREKTTEAGTELNVTRFPAGFLQMIGVSPADDPRTFPRIEIELLRTVVSAEDGSTHTEQVATVSVPDDADEIYVLNRNGDTVDSYRLDKRPAAAAR